LGDYSWTKTVIDIFCICFLCMLAWMWIVGQIVDDWLEKRRERKRLEKRKLLQNRMSALQEDSKQGRQRE
jgi:sensor domain CHASE-containing protein